MDNAKYFLKWMLFFFIGAILFGSLFVMRSTGSGIRAEEPFLSNASALATDGEHIYVMDDTFNRISKYRTDGTFLWCVHYSTMGSSYIFCSAEGALCRHDIREDTTYVYAEDGRVAASYPEDIRVIPEQERVTVDNSEYELKTHLIVRDEVHITRGQERITLKIGAPAGNFVFNLLCVMFAACMLYAVCNLIRFIMPLVQRKP